MDEKLGFGEVEKCLLKVGITCEECKYRHVCFDDISQMEQDEEIAYYEELIEG